MPAATVRLAPSNPAPTSDLQAALAEVDRHLGPGVATTPDSPSPAAAIATGSLALDLALGVGGIPKGRITEIYGSEGVGKTTLALSVIVQAQQADGTACYIDAEHALDLRWATSVGVDLSADSVPARVRGTGPPGRQPPHPIRGRRGAGHRLGRRPSPQGRTGGRNRRAPPWRPGEPAQPIPAPAVRSHRPGQHRGAGNQPTAPAGRHPWHSDLYRRRPGTGVLRLGPPGPAPYPGPEGRRAGNRRRLRVLVAKNKLAAAGQTSELEVRDDRGVCESASVLEDRTPAAS
jgi:hypothetical protein